MGLGDATALAALDHFICHDVDWPLPSVWVALFTDATSVATIEGGTLTNECAYTGYARVSTSGSDWNGAAAGSTTNANDIVFPAATGGSETARFVALMDASTAGTVLCVDQIDVDLSIVSGITPKFMAGDLEVSVNGIVAGAGDVEFIDMLTGKTDYAPAATMYAALYAGFPVASDITLGEASYDNYARVAVTASDWDAASGGKKAHAAILSFPECGASGSGVVYYGLVTTASGAGVLIGWGLHSSTISPVTQNVVPTYIAGEFELRA